MLVCSLLTAAAPSLLELHGPDGQRVFINEWQINSLRQPTAFDVHRFFPKGARCIVLTTDSKFIAVVETCDVVRGMMTGDHG